MMHYAHTKKNPDGTPAPEKEWEPLFSEKCATLEGGHCEKCEALDSNHGHSNKVAYLTGKFAAEMFPEGSMESVNAKRWGHLAGLWHDLGKFPPEWQAYLKTKVDPHYDDATGTVDHSTAGAQHANQNIPLLGKILGYVIAGHHAGLADGITSSSGSLENRLKKTNIPNASNAPEHILNYAKSLLPVPSTLSSAYSLSFYTRMLYSTLVDADFLATEAFMSPLQTTCRKNGHPSIIKLEQTLNNHLDQLRSQATQSKVNTIRSEILGNCLKSAEQRSGLFSLTVPTGGGKTLSSLAFALKHARLHNLERVIYVIPFTSIIEQNAAVFRKALTSLGSDIILEHHSNLDPDAKHETIANRLASENWDARIIVTTNVQFFESLHANRTSRCRKLHRIARSVVILDEAQSIPVELLDPCLRSIEELTNHYNTSVVLCTATQPAITRNEEFKIGLQSPIEIIPKPQKLYQQLRRVQPRILAGKTSDTQLISDLSSHKQVLCIVNTRRQARELYDQLPDNGSRFHLSALMCPQHRSVILYLIKCKLRSKKSVRLISTQLIEAGVDIDFPVVYRSLAGLDSIAQAAGRCDREGKLTEANGKPAGKLIVFTPEASTPLGFIRASADSAFEVLAANPADPLDLHCIQQYFRTHYWKHADETDKHHIADCWPRLWPPSQEEELLCFSFKECADKFQFIEDYTEPIIIPFGAKGKKLCDQLRESYDPAELRHLSRKLQRYTVSIPKPQHAELLRCGILLPLHENQFFLLNSDAHYDPNYGLHPHPDITLSTQAII
jgi:CRISPR-associated endonuclease/helicase Cas3